MSGVSFVTIDTDFTYVWVESRLVDTRGN